jgi:hypothetical protein
MLVAQMAQAAGRERPSPEQILLEQPELQQPVLG